MMSWPFLDLLTGPVGERQVPGMYTTTAEESSSGAQRWPAVPRGEGHMTGLAPGPPASSQVPLSPWNDNQGFERYLASCKSKAFLWTVFWLFSCKPMDYNFCKCLWIYLSSLAREQISWQRIRAGPPSVWGGQKGWLQLLCSLAFRWCCCLSHPGGRASSPCSPESLGSGTEVVGFLECAGWGNLPYPPGGTDRQSGFGSQMEVDSSWLGIYSRCLLRLLAMISLPLQWGAQFHSLWRGSRI